jgi:hypothetical protein
MLLSTAADVQWDAPGRVQVPGVLCGCVWPMYQGRAGTIKDESPCELLNLVLNTAVHDHGGTLC